MPFPKVSRRSLPILAAIACAILAAAAPAQEAYREASPAIARIVAPIDENRLTTLVGNTRPEARAQFDRGPVESNLPMGDLFLVLKRSPEVQSAFEAFLASQQDANSPEYHHWLTPEEIGERFGPAQADIDTITRWLQNRGFSVASVSKDRMLIRFDGLAGQVQSAFHTEIHNLNVRGESHIANMTDPRIPEALTPVLAGVKALHNFFPRPLHHVGGAVRRKPGGGWERIAAGPAKPASTVAPSSKARDVHPVFGTGGTTSGLANIEDVAPYDFAAIYNVLPLWNAATPIIGTGQTIAIAGTSNINPADITTFRSAFFPAALAAGKAPIFYTGNTDPGDCPGFTSDCADDLIENTLDVEWSGAVAPGAQIILVGSSAVTASTDPLFISETFIVDNTNGKINAKIMNVSYGECELGLGTSGNSAYNTLWSTAQGEGLAVFVSTGDSGSASCDDGMDSSTPYGAEYGLSVSGIASTAYNTAVGGTDFAWAWDTNGQSKYWSATNNATTTASALGYIPEFPWNDTCANSNLDAVINTALDSNLTPGEICDDIGDGEITFSGQTAAYLVDIVGDGGGNSSCINGDGATVASCTKGYPKPSWQTGVTGIPADGARDIPDVSFFSADGFSGSAYVICVSASGTCSYTEGSEPTGEEVGGTSVSSPAMAGVMALINQKAGSAQGSPNAKLYKLAAAEKYGSCSSESIPLTGSACVFNDVDTGANAVACELGAPNCPATDELYFSVLSGWSATAGYDLASGLGSMNVTNLVNAFAPTVTAPAVTLTPTSLTFAAVAEGVADPTQSLTVKNTGNATLTFTGISISGADATSFTQTHTCGASLAAGATCTVTVTFKPEAASGTLTATVSIADNATGSPQTVSLTGSVLVPTPAVSLSPTSLTFAAVAEGVADPTQAITVKNTGNAALTFTGISIAGVDATSFTQTHTCGASLTAGASCTVTVTFKPEAALGTLTATLSIADNATGSPQKVSLTGSVAVVAPAPVVSLSATSLTFAAVAEGVADPTQSVTLKNTGNAALTFTGITITGADPTSFPVGNTCGKSIAAGASCTITVDFKPEAASGTLTATVSIADNASGSPQKVSLTGSVLVLTPAASLSSTSLTFPATVEGAAAATQAVTLKNTGNGALAISKISIAGADPTSFSETNTCGASLAAAASCAITVTFKPEAASGTLTASVSVADNAAGSPQTVSLSGSVLVLTPAVSLTPTTLTFASTAEGTAATAKTVTLKNTGTGTLSLTKVSVGGADPSSFSETNTCGASVAAGASCAITVTFKPEALGALTASVSLADNAAGSPQTVSVSGTGADEGTYSLTAAALTVAPGASGTSKITATGAMGYAGPNTVTLSGCTLATSPSGAVDSPTCTITDATVTFASGSSSGSGGVVTVGTTAATAAVKLGRGGPGGRAEGRGKLWSGVGGVVAAGLMLFAVPARRRVWRSMLGVFLFAATLGALSGCGGGVTHIANNTGTSSPGTTAGSYTFTITGTDAGGVKQTATLTVTVS